MWFFRRRRKILGDFAFDPPCFRPVRKQGGGGQTQRYPLIIDLSGSENPLKTIRLVRHPICSQFDSIWINLALVFARIWTDICSIFGFWHVIPDGWFFWADFGREGVETGCSKCEKWVFQPFLHRFRWCKIFLRDFLKSSNESEKKNPFSWLVWLENFN